MHIRLQIVKGPAKGRSFTFSRADRLTAGRSSDNQLRLDDDEEISPHHFLIELNPPNLRLRDLGSRSGTFVNDSSDSVGAVELHPGDRIRAGRTEMTISLDENLAFAKTLPEHSVTKVPVLCHRCGAKADCEAPRAPEEDVIYYCGGCQSDLLRKPHLPPGYELVRELGRGGMGAIFLIHSLAQDELRAMKVMLPHVAMAAENRQLFLREARRHATLSHKNVVLLHDTHELHPGVFCMVMEYVEGGSAADKLKRSGGRGLPQKEAVAIISQALSGLDHAHTRGIVHRDIKEANLLIGSGPTPVIKLADFGLAKSFEEAGATSLNSSAVVAGTVGYMAPEQITDFRNVGTSADVYSVGATLYSLLTGALPYDFLPSADPMPNLLKVLEEPVVPLRQRRPDVSEALAAAVDRALLRDPKHRFTTALEMQSAILSAV